ncbi:glycosyltransferase family protein [Peptococcaceae bacterium]|nr:glycosyltransferase family protein [Peptococcaceae bacterium]
MKIGAIIQARMASTRLPEKVLKFLPYDSEITVLEQVLRRTKKSNLVDEIIIATTTGAEDDDIIAIAKKEDVKWFRGSLLDVLERYYLAAKENKLNVILRVTSDCPCIDWDVMDRSLGKLLKENLDYVGSSGYPRGCGDVECMTFSTLERLHLEADKDFEREHVCPYIYKTAPHRFKIGEIKAKEKLFAPDIRVTLDTLEDYAVLCAIFDFLYDKNPFFQTQDVIELFNKKPWLKFINQHVVQKTVG